ncbi:MAG: aminodeoxychorismate/anthranilate synthase component II [Thermoanaerobaculales bacterium]|jgi:anthranilate synthase component 2|nr:aminodeoxychorismate/anthranilate synthase component II [Thermoanaerobaculales bacterium]
MLDNYDSFTYNLVQELEQIGETEVEVVRNDAASVAELLARAPRAVVISPGPGAPEEAGVTMELVQRAAALPLLGICLGHQALAAAHGGRVVRAAAPVHGKTSAIRHGGAGVFAGLPEPFEATRYHSLVVAREGLPADLEITAWTDDGTIMGLRHRGRPHFGVQFHPESYLCTEGRHLLARFLELAGLPVRPEWQRR